MMTFKRKRNHHQIHGNRRYRRRVALACALGLVVASSSGRFGAAVAQGPAQISPEALA